jgi:hypothetical protein
MEGKMYINIRHIAGISEQHAEKLQDAGIFSAEDLIEATSAPKLAQTMAETGIWRLALLNYGVMARTILAAENDFYKLVKGGHLIFVEEDLEDEPPDEEELNGIESLHRYGFRIVGKPGRERHFVRVVGPQKAPSRQAICLPPAYWMKSR